MTASVIAGWIFDYDDYAATRRSEPKPRSAWDAGHRRDQMAVASARAGCTLAARERSGASDSWAASGRANDPATEGSRPLLSRPPNLQVLAAQRVAGTRSLGLLCDRQAGEDSQRTISSEGEFAAQRAQGGAVALTWESFSEARGEDGLVHVVKHGDKDVLCGVRVLAGDIRGRRRCPRCRSLRREALRQGSGRWVPE